MDGDYAPCALHAELLEEGGRDDGFATGVGVRVQQGTADDRDEDYGEAAAEDLGGVADHGTAGHGAEVCDYLGYGHGVGAEVVLVG